MVPLKFLSRWIPRLSNVATTPTSANRFAYTAPPLLTASGTPRWRPSALAQRVPPGFPAFSSPSRRLSSYAPPANNVEDERKRSGNDSFCFKDASGTTLEVMDSKPDTSGEVVVAAATPDYLMEIFPNSSHRDGSIYSGTDDWKIDYRIADRNETWLEAMMFSDPTDCRMHNGICESHASRHMLQFLSLRLANIPAEIGSVELYGYIAARDNMNPLLNYIVHFSRDDPIILKQGSLINMAGPKRGIELVGTILIEYDMRIKAGEHEKEDLQVIDGVSYLDNIDTWDRTPFIFRIYGDCGAIDVGVSRLNFAYEATIEVVISQVQSSFSMRLSCFTSGLHEEIRLFDGAIGESRGLKRYVVAVASDDQMELKFTVAADSCVPAEHFCCFEAKQHGRATQEISTGFALITVKVTWSTLNKPRRITTTLD
ncbi:uncharacterized protein [Lolium perenne]|uniref:uncharacterized protein n=1 Tax=Lolium perenne TaxID=4522 RepID=UPI0021F5D10A|nr:uncharacterized protein LOC127319653 [Lolium perenne]